MLRGTVGGDQRGLVDFSVLPYIEDTAAQRRRNVAETAPGGERRKALLGIKKALLGIFTRVSTFRKTITCFFTHGVPVAEKAGILIDITLITIILRQTGQKFRIIRFHESAAARFQSSRPGTSTENPHTAGGTNPGQKFAPPQRKS